MRTAAAVLNIILFIFTCFVLWTDGLSKETPYIVFTVLLLLVPIPTSAVLLRTRSPRAGQGTHHVLTPVSAVAGRLALVGNLVLIGFACWAIVAQYPHPKEEGAFAAASLTIFTLLVVLTPLLSVLALLRPMKVMQPLPPTVLSHQEPQRDA